MKRNKKNIYWYQGIKRKILYSVAFLCRMVYFSQQQQKLKRKMKKKIRGKRGKFPPFKIIDILFPTVAVWVNFPFINFWWTDLFGFFLAILPKFFGGEFGIFMVDNTLTFLHEHRVVLGWIFRRNLFSSRSVRENVCVNFQLGSFNALFFQQTRWCWCKSPTKIFISRHGYKNRWKIVIFLNFLLFVGRCVFQFGGIYFLSISTS